MMFCKKNIVRHGYFVIAFVHAWWINTASVKHYLKAVTAIEAKQSALHARKPLIGGREPHLCSVPFGPRAYRDSPPLAG